MIVSIIAALDKNWGIGINNRLPWYLPRDLEFFKKTTLGHHLNMGRKTYESIGKPLPGRHIIVLTRNLTYKRDGVKVAHSLEQALHEAEAQHALEVFIGGGADIYTSAIDLTDKLYLTRIHATFDVDTYFPRIELNEWRCIRKNYFEPDKRNMYALTIYLYERF